MFRRYVFTLFRTVPKRNGSETPCEHQKIRNVKKEDVTLRYKAKRSETVSFHYFYRNGIVPFLAPKRSETNVSSDLSVTKMVSKQYETVTSEHGLKE